MAKDPANRDKPTDCRMFGSQYREYCALDGSIEIQQKINQYIIFDYCLMSIHIKEYNNISIPYDQFTKKILLYANPTPNQKKVQA